eukprot:CAMPEP_0171147194 /NCGR_PEP_ID=MMETSP0766_2-20121228/147946_1 /TAXON_ID=439317 /ORGANISM="Gambierdiscus australes, Strain CAWD 149" /LENGTH=110 /DNA_ID=CAMNT_0011611103 /DNA_START=589 /DNA_END=919 /DNA_ORIENTATION=+
MTLDGCRKALTGGSRVVLPTPPISQGVARLIAGVPATRPTGVRAPLGEASPGLVQTVALPAVAPEAAGQWQTEAAVAAQPAYSSLVWSLPHPSTHAQGHGGALPCPLCEQ